MTEQIGDHYILLKSDIRSGGLSTVRKAVDTRDGSSVAVKLIVGATDELSQRIFEREVRTLRILKHPNIVGYRDSGIDETGTYYVVLDWIERGLKDVLDQGVWDSWDTLYIEFAKALVDAVAFAHLNSVEHRDIKPQNVLVDRSGQPLVADFGIAKLRFEQPDSGMTVAAFRSGPYAPPEQVSTIPYVRDVYSLGVLLIQCMYLDRISDFPDIAVALDAINVPPDVKTLLAECVSSDPSERPKNASDLASRLARIYKNRRNLLSEARKPVWLRLTNAAVQKLSSQGSRPAAVASLEADLSGECFASFRFDHESGEVDRSTVILSGKTYRYTLKSDADGSGCVVIAVIAPEFEALESLRRRSVLLPGIFKWSATEPVRRAAGVNGLALLIEVVEDHYENRDKPPGAEIAAEGDELFDSWLRILDAREELERGTLEPMEYRRCRHSGRRSTFTLSHKTELDLIGTEWQVREPQAGRKYGWGEVIEQDSDTVTLIGDRFSSVPHRAALYAHIGPSEVALARQREAVLAVRTGSALRPELRGLLLDPGSASPPVAVEVRAWNSDLDTSKRDAVRFALGAPDALLIQGPPGTGKTRFIAEMVSQYLQANARARVLIASQTHVAVDNALTRLDQIGLRSIVRLAGPDDSRVDSSVRHLLLDAQTRAWAKKVQARAEDAIEHRAGLRGVSASHLRAALALQQLATASQQIAIIRRSLDGAVSDALSSGDLVTALDITEDQTEIQERLDGLVDFRAELIADARSSLGGDLTIPTDIGPAQARHAIDALLGHGPEASELLRMVELQAEWLQRIGADNSLSAVYLETASVVAGTCTGFLRHRAVRSLEFDLCIIDEASKATITEALVPMSRAKRWIMVGDTRQLPPTDEDLLRARELLREHDIDRSDVTETLFQRMADLLPGESQLMLREQYRMIRPIGDLISTCFYDGELQSPREEGLSGYEKVFGRPVLWLDTSGLGDRRRESAPEGQATSFANRIEAQLVIGQLKTLQGALDYGVIKPSSDSLDVLVISPYRSQVDELRRRLAPISFKNLQPVVMSVDAVQGRESDIVLFSITRSNEEQRLGFLGVDYWRRINVALSRARYGLTIVGDAAFVRETAGALRSVLQYVEDHPNDCELRPAQL